MKNPRIAVLVQSLVFLIPVNVYVIGDWLGTGIQWVLFRSQVTYLGENLFSFTNDLNYVRLGLIHGRSEWAILLWAFAVFLLLGCFIINLFNLCWQSTNYVKKTFLITIFCGFLFVISDIIQYGMTFNGAAGFCIPVGVPAIVLIGFFGYRYPSTDGFTKMSDQNNNQEEGKEFWDIIITRIKGAFISNDLLFLISVSIIVKFILFFSSLYAPFESVTGDVDLYYRFASLLVSGRIPYIDFAVEYPPLVFIPALIAFIPTFISPAFSTYLFSYMVLMFFVDAATLACVYLISLRFFGKSKAFLCGFLYATAISAAFYTPITYDIVPTFFLMFSLLLYLNRKEIPSYMAAALGTLTKWFPAFSIPYFFIHSLKSGTNRFAETAKGFLVVAILFGIFTIPFFIVNRNVFLITYSIHLSRGALTHSLTYYIDAILQLLFQTSFFGQFSLILLIIVETGLLYYFFRFTDIRLITLSYFIFLSVFFFVLFNNGFSASYIIWLTPFLAIFLAHSNRHIILFYLIEIIIYIETPLLYRIVYGDGRPYYVIENSLPSFSFVFYSIKFLIYFAVLWVVVHNAKNSLFLEE